MAEVVGMGGKMSPECDSGFVGHREDECVDAASSEMEQVHSPRLVEVTLADVVCARPSERLG